MTDCCFCVEGFRAGRVGPSSYNCLDSVINCNQLATGRPATVLVSLKLH